MKRFVVHHGLRYETEAQKIRWFRSLPFSERYRLMADMNELLKPPPKRHPRKPSKTIQILKLSDLDNIKALRSQKSRRA